MYSWKQILSFHCQLAWVYILYDFAREAAVGAINRQHLIILLSGSIKHKSKYLTLCMPRFMYHEYKEGEMIYMDGRHNDNGRQGTHA